MEPAPPASGNARPTQGTDQHRRAALLDLSAIYVEAKMAFADAIVDAKRAGMDEAEIARVTGFTVPMIRAVLRTP